MATNTPYGPCVGEIADGFAEECVVEPETGPSGMVATVLENVANLAAEDVTAAVGSSVVTKEAASKAVVTVASYISITTASIARTFHSSRRVLCFRIV